MERRDLTGNFDGQHMQGTDSKVYPVPANYASKSKLVYGDELRLTITEEGEFLFKQIGPVERKRICGLAVDLDGEIFLNAQGKAYKIIQSTKTFFGIVPGDEVIAIIPKNVDCDWATVENVIKCN
jgi:hypothetical protein